MFLERSPTLLLVDSHDSSRRALAELLRDSGFDTSALSPAIRRRVSRAGCAGFLEKPCPPGDIFAAVHGILYTASLPYPAPGLRTCVSH